MNDQQFVQFTQGLANQETERQTINAGREQVRDVIRQTTTCDGSTTQSVRLWIREVGLAYNQLGARNIIGVILQK